MPRKFYRNVYTVVVLTEDAPVDPDLELPAVMRECEDGAWSGDVESVEATELSPAEMAQALIKQGSDPGFFNLDEAGNNILDTD